MIFNAWAILALSVLAAAQNYSSLLQDRVPYYPSVFFNLTLPATFPYLRFNPDGNDYDDDGPWRWGLSYTEGPTDNYVPGMMGFGTATMTSGRVNVLSPPPEMRDVRFSFYYHGNGFWVHGTFDGQSDDPYAKTPDGVDFLRLVVPAVGEDPGYPTEDLLVGAGQRSFGYNEVLLSNNNGTMSITGVTLTTGIVTEAPTFGEVNVTVVPFVTPDDRPNPDFVYPQFRNSTPTDFWEVAQTIGGINGQPLVPYKTLRTIPRERVDQIKTGYGRASVAMKVPANTSFAFLNGTIGPDHSSMRVTVAPVPPERLGGSEILDGNCTSRWVSPGILWFSVLDPTVQYNITIDPFIYANSTIAAYHSMTFYSGLWSGSLESDNSGSSSPYAPHGPKINKGAIAGGVVGGVIGVLILVAVGWVCFSRRASQKVEQAEWSVEPTRVVLPEATTLVTQPSSSTQPRPTPETGTDESGDVQVVAQQEDGDDDVELLPPTYKPQWSSSTA